jgi:hypothetical protein
MSRTFTLQENINMKLEQPHLEYDTVQGTRDILTISLLLISKHCLSSKMANCGEFMDIVRQGD